MIRKLMIPAVAAIVIMAGVFAGNATQTAHAEGGPTATLPNPIVHPDGWINFSLAVEPMLDCEKNTVEYELSILTKSSVYVTEESGATFPARGIVIHKCVQETLRGILGMQYDAIVILEDLAALEVPGPITVLYFEEWIRILIEEADTVDGGLVFDRLIIMRYRLFVGGVGS